MAESLLAFASLSAFGPISPAQTAPCTTGLCRQQVSCPAGQTTTVSGTVYAPNGVDPLPNVLLYIPNATVPAFVPGVACQAPGQLPGGSPIVGTTSAVDGTFVLSNVPVGSNIPLVIQIGRWRRQVTIPGVAQCTNTAFSTRMPQNQSEGDIPKIAIVTGSQDALECVLRKIGVADSEFTDGGGLGRIQIYKGAGSPGAQISSATPSENLLMDTQAGVNAYDVVMYGCQGTPFAKSATQLSNLVAYANAGGRVFATHLNYTWLFKNPPFDGTATWAVRQSDLPDGLATVDQTFPGGKNLADWLQLVGATTTKGQMAIATPRKDQNGVVPPTQSWLTLNDSAHNNPVLQFTFNTPVGAASAQQCGRILFNEYHVENPTSNIVGSSFPTECSSQAMTPQEKLLEYSLFDLSGNGSGASLVPFTQDFGSQPVGFASASKTFTWSNTSIFPSTVSTVVATGDFGVTSNGCSAPVPAGGNCQINVAFTPTAIGSRTGTLTVGFGSAIQVSTLTGSGIADLQSSSAALDFGKIDIGADSLAQTLTISNVTPATIPLAAPSLIGPYILSTTCGASLASLASCAINIAFRPTVTGPQPGTMTLNSTSPSYAGIATTLAGTGVDFSISVAPTSGSAIAGLPSFTIATLTPIAGYATPVSITCTTNAPGSTCIPNVTSTVPNSGSPVNINITTTSKYTVVGYSGLGGALALLGLGCGSLLWIHRRRSGSLLRLALLSVLVAAAAMVVTGCSGKLPDLNNPYTPVGSYTYTVTATDGILTHSATYMLNVTLK